MWGSHSFPSKLGNERVSFTPMNFALTYPVWTDRDYKAIEVQLILMGSLNNFFPLSINTRVQPDETSVEVFYQMSTVA